MLRWIAMRIYKYGLESLIFMGSFMFLMFCISVSFFIFSISDSCIARVSFLGRITEVSNTTSVLVSSFVFSNSCCLQQLAQAHSSELWEIFFNSANTFYATKRLIGRRWKFYFYYEWINRITRWLKIILTFILVHAHSEIICCLQLQIIIPFILMVFKMD